MVYNSKKEFYKQARIAGLVLFLPFVLAAGPLAGHFAGEYFRKKFGFGQAASIIFIALGFISSIIETIRLIKLAIRIDKER